MKLSISELITSILEEAGLTDIIDKDINSHSTITLSMADSIPDINIAECDGKVVVWSDLGEYNASTLSYVSSELLSIIINLDEELFDFGQPSLYHLDGNLELRALIKEENQASPNAFLLMLNRFLEIQQLYSNVLK